MSKPSPVSPSPVLHDTTLHVRDHCLCLNAQRAARALARHFDEAFRPLGLTSGQFSLMMALNRPKPPSLGPVAALLAMDRTTLSAALKPLVRRALVTVEDDPSDRRSRLLRLTAQGRDVLARATPVWQATHAAIDRALAGAPGGELSKGLRAVVDTLADAANPPA